MEFDESRVYTALDAEKLKVGDKVYVDNNPDDLECNVKNERDIAVIDKIYPRNTTARFRVRFCHSEWYDEYCLAYLVERAKEKKYRPYKNVDELLSDYGKRYRDTTGFDFIDNALCLPIIWIREKTSPFISVGINGYDKIGNNILLGTLGWCCLDRLFNIAEFLDGTPCGKEIEE